MDPVGRDRPRDGPDRTVPRSAQGTDRQLTAPSDESLLEPTPRAAGRRIAERLEHPMKHPTRRKERVREVTDPVCGMRVDPRSAISRQGPDGHPHFFCAPVCADKYTEATSLARQATDSS